jgi:hypothetical protein
MGFWISKGLKARVLPHPALLWSNLRGSGTLRGRSGKISDPDYCNIHGGEITEEAPKVVKGKKRNA